LAKGVRVNLSLPERFDAVLAELANHSGRSKASWVMEAIEFQLPAWWKRLEAMKYGTPLEVLPSADNRGRVELARSQRQLRAIERYEEIKATPADTQSLGSLQAAPAAAPTVRLNRKQRRELERAERKRLRREGLLG
jgi:hypothetical protein